MDFLEIVEQARDILHSKGRVTYRTLKRQFALDDEALGALRTQRETPDRATPRSLALRAIASRAASRTHQD